MENRSFAGRLISWPKPSTVRRKWIAALLCFVGLCGLGFFDYSLGAQISLLVFYILPIGFATVYVGPWFAVFLATFSVFVWKEGDLLSGVPYPGAVILFWNGTIVFSLFVIVITLLHFLNRTLQGLESTVTERTSQLKDEMVQRRRMEREIIDLSEKERQRFGRDLHDVVCQDLVSMAIASDMLTRKLLALELPEAEHSDKIAKMSDNALAKARSIARGFFITGFDTAGLEEALREAIRAAAERNRISCVVHWQEKLTIANRDTVIQLFRIAQEAFQNAIKHAGASLITVSLQSKEKVLQLIVEDNGVGFNESDHRGKGLGLNIMAYRASLIGAEFKIERPAGGGTRVVCLVSADKLISRVAEVDA
jgi:signal transduction histidine kinase